MDNNTTNITEIIEKTKELGKLLENSNQVKALAAARAAYEQNADIQELNGQFNIHKMSIAALSRQENPDEERISGHEQKLKEIYDSIMSSKVMTEYQKSTQAVEQLVSEINNILNFYITGQTPQGCTGSCATCSGCSGK